MEPTKEQRMAALAMALSELMETVAEFYLIDTETAVVRLFEGCDASMAEIITKTQVLAREVLSLNETVH